MDLHLPPEVAAPTKIITCNIEGFIEPEDLHKLLQAPKTVEDAVETEPDLKKIRERHHSVARLVAQGYTNGLIAVMAGYTESYISVLLNSPAMQELINLYRIKNGSVHEVIGERLRTVGLKALERIDSKLDNPQQEFEVHELAAVAKLGLDRAGHGPSSTQHVVNEDHIIDHAKIAELNQRARQGSKELIIPRQAALPAPKEVDDAAV